MAALTRLVFETVQVHKEKKTHAIGEEIKTRKCDRMVWIGYYKFLIKDNLPGKSRPENRVLDTKQKCEGIEMRSCLCAGGTKIKAIKTAIQWAN